MFSKLPEQPCYYFRDSQCRRVFVIIRVTTIGNHSLEKLQKLTSLGLFLYELTTTSRKKNFVLVANTFVQCNYPMIVAPYYVSNKRVRSCDCASK